MVPSELLLQDYKHYSSKIYLLEWKFKCLTMLKENKLDDLRQELKRVGEMQAKDTEDARDPSESFFSQNDTAAYDSFVSVSKTLFDKIDLKMKELQQQDPATAGSDTTDWPPEKQMFAFNKNLHLEKELAKEEQVAIEVICMQPNASLTKEL